MQSFDALKFVSLRTHPEFLEETANLLNTTWPRSLTYRLHYLAETGDDFPCSFIFLQKDQKHGSKVIGHARLNKIIGNTSAAFLTCVIVDKDFRGCGLGKKLMELIEEKAKELGCTAMYLSTFEKCEFYKHLGYHCCSQVTPMRTSTHVFTSCQIALLGGPGSNQKLDIENDHGSQNVICRAGESELFNIPVNKEDNSSFENSQRSLHNAGYSDLNYATNLDRNELSDHSNYTPQMLTSPSPSPSLSPVETLVAISPPPYPPPSPPFKQQPSNSQLCKMAHRSKFWMMKELQ